MDIHYSTVLRDPKRLQLLEPISAQLNEILRIAPAPLPTATWDLVPNTNGRELYRLSMQDHAGKVFNDFTPDDLKNSSLMQIRLSRLWGDLLKIQSDLQRERVRSLIQQYEPSAE